jgi:signal transduction histidine kinase
MLSIKKAFLISVSSIIIVFSIVILSWTYIYQKDAISNAVLIITISIVTVVPLLYFLSHLIKKDIDKLIENIKKDSFENSFKMNEFHAINNHFRNLSKNLHKSNKKKEILIQRLQAINESKNEIISAISHEFKNPISIMSGYVQTILENDLDKSTEIKFLKKIEKNGLKLSNLIDRLYFIAKLENEKIKLKKSKYNLIELVQNSIEQIDNKRVILKYKEDSIIECDKNLIEIVITNLVTNALKYSKDEIIIEIEVKNISIIDNGIGISEENLSHIKEKFYRVSKNDWDNSLGLGLSIVERILTLHNSHLEIESEIGKGSKFSFSF